MRQVVQKFRSGELRVAEVPEPRVPHGGLLVANVRSLISAGTEKSTVNMAKKSILGKAMERPDLVRKVYDKLRKDGVAETAGMVLQRLDSPVALGYSSAGIVVDVGEGVRGFSVGDRVACAGQNYASHAELIAVPRNLCVRIPDDVDFDDAAFVTLGAIALQAVRQSEPRLGEIVAVIGLGLLGQLTVQMLRANGCRVVATDLEVSKRNLAARFGAERAVAPEALAEAGLAMSGGHGADAVIIAASTKENGPVEAAGEICRHKGRVVVLGAVRMELPRESFYQKELELRLSTSYGPGRYDPVYEEKGQDYPYGYVRWTEGRNMEAFLWLVHEGKVDCKALTTHRFDIDRADQAYQMMVDGSEPYLGILLEYPGYQPARARASAKPAVGSPDGRVALGLIGPGNHVRDMLLPQLKGRAEVGIRWICTGTGINADTLGDRLSVDQRTTDYRSVLADPAVNAVLIGTRHDSHAQMVVASLEAGKHVFVEKPLALTENELDVIRDTYEKAAARGLRLAVGFNRRHSEHALKIREFFGGRNEPLVMCYRVNAGGIPPTHWIQDPAIGGGRIIGEGCHFIDFMQFVCGALPVRVRGLAVDRHSSGINEDHSILNFGFADGSIGTLVYAAGGDKTLPKERFEAIGSSRSVVLDDFVVTEFYSDGRKRRFKSGKRDKGFSGEMSAFCAEVAKGAPPVTSFAEIDAVSRISILAARALSTGDEYSI